jgi:hypothetical protein
VLNGEKERREKESVALLAEFRVSSGANRKSKYFIHLLIFCPACLDPIEKERVKSTGLKFYTDPNRAYQRSSVGLLLYWIDFILLINGNLCVASFNL